MGRIAFSVLGELHMGKCSNTFIGVEVMLKNQKTEQVHKSLINYKQDKWIECINNLATGVYVIDEYYEMVMVGLLPRRSNLKKASQRKAFIYVQYYRLEVTC